LKDEKKIVEKIANLFIINFSGLQLIEFTLTIGLTIAAYYFSLWMITEGKSQKKLR